LGFAILVFRFRAFGLRLPIFILSCGIGGVLSIARAMCSVASSRLGIGLFAMADPPDLDRVENWPPQGLNVGSVAHVHAFGMIALSSAMMEESLTLLLSHFLRLDWGISLPLVHKLAIRERVDLLKKLTSATESEGTLLGYPPNEDAETISTLRYALECFEICNENRNILIHALYERTDHTTATMTVSKRAHNNPLHEFKLDLSLTELRQTAEEIGHTVNLMLDVWLAVTHPPPPNMRAAWPKRPPRPHKLTPTEPAAALPAAQRPPRP
jgi:hypothetical protein